MNIRVNALCTRILNFWKKYFQFRNFLIIKSLPSIKSIYICLLGPQFLVSLTLKAHTNSNQRRLNFLNLLYCTLRSLLSDNALINLYFFSIFVDIKLIENRYNHFLIWEAVRIETTCCITNFIEIWTSLNQIKSLLWSAPRPQPYQLSSLLFEAIISIISWVHSHLLAQLRLNSQTSLTAARPAYGQQVRKGHEEEANGRGAGCPHQAHEFHEEADPALVQELRGALIHSDLVLLINLFMKNYSC